MKRSRDDVVDADELMSAAVASSRRRRATVYGVHLCVLVSASSLVSLLTRSPLTVCKRKWRKKEKKG